MNLSLYFDGACEPTNPGGTGSWGFVLTDPDGADVARSGAVPASPRTTNNLCEWLALGHGLRQAADLLTTAYRAEASARWDGGLTGLKIFGDSQLVIHQLTGKWACNAENLRPLRARCLELLAHIGLPWAAVWVPRDLNTKADALSVRAWETATGRPFPHRPRRGAAR